METSVAPVDEPWSGADQTQLEVFAAIEESRARQGLPESELDALLKRGLTKDRLPRYLKNQRAADAFQHAFELVGGIPRLAVWADKNPSAFYALYSKLIPATVKAQVDSTITINAPWMVQNRLSYREDAPVISEGIQDVS